MGESAELDFQAENRRLRERIEELERQLAQAHASRADRALNAPRRCDLLSEHSRDVILYLRRQDGRILGANAAAGKAYGYTRDELLELSIRDLVSAELHEGLPHRMAQADAAGVLFETVHRRKDGSTFPVEVSSQGATIGGTRTLISVVRDITERKRAEANLREGEERFVKAFYKAPVAMSITAIEDDTFIDVNDKFTELSGFRREEAVGKTSSELGWTTGEPSRRLLEALGDCGWASGFEPEFRTKAGERRHCLYFGGIITLAGSARLLSIVVDVTDRKRLEAERKQAAEELRRSEERLRLTLEATSEGVWDWNLPSGQVYFSPHYCGMLGYQPHEFGTSYDSWRSLVHPDDIARADAARWEHLRNGKEFTVELRMRMKSGGWCWILNRGMVVERDAEGKPVRMVGTHADITAHKQAAADRATLEEEFRQAQKLESVGRLAGGVAHDFGNLLTVINGYGDLLLRKLQPGDPMRDKVAELRKAGERAAALTSQLLIVSRSQIVEPRPLDLNRLLTEDLDMVQSLLGENIDLVTRLAPGLGRVLADPGQLHQVLINLVVNARDAMPGGGTFTIETANVEAGEGGIPGLRDSKQAPFVLLTVRDTGTGIEKEIQNRIFDPFFTTKSEGKGTGLGLALVYGIVRQGGGSITVESQPGDGATFRIYLPRTDAEAPPHAAATAPPEDLRGCETVLVVEDQDPVRTLVVETLESYGYEILQAAHGADALRIAEHHTQPIHLLLTDVIMPYMDGKELAARAASLRPAMKVIFMSGFSADVDPGAVCIGKPFTPDELAAKVREVLGPMRAGPA